MPAESPLQHPQPLARRCEQPTRRRESIPGTLDRYTVFVRGTLTVNSIDSWEFEGEASLWDIWDFDPGNDRGMNGEALTAGGQVLLSGDGLHLTSPWFLFSQSSNDDFGATFDDMSPGVGTDGGYY